MGNSQQTDNGANRTPIEPPIVQVYKRTFKYLVSKDAAANSSCIATSVLKHHLHIDDCQFTDRFLTGLRPRFSQPGFVQEKEFLELGTRINDLSPGSRSFTEFYTDLLSSAQLDKKEAYELIMTAYCASCAVNKIPNRSSGDQLNVRFKPAIDSLFNRDKTIPSSTFVSWAQRHCTLLFAALHSWLLKRWRTPAARDPAPVDVPELLGQLETNHSRLESENLFFLSTVLPALFFHPQHSHRHVSNLCHWISLYDSNLHGLSITRFEHHVFSYKGPTVSVVSFDDHVYLIASQEEWRDSKERWGGAGCLMMQLCPKYRFIQGGASMLMLNLTSRAVPRGFQFGKDPRSVMLEVNQDLTEVKHYGVVAKLDRFEVFGCGSAEVREAQLQQKKWEHSDVEKHKNRKLKLEDWKDSPDRLLLEMGGLKVTNSEDVDQQ